MFNHELLKPEIQEFIFNFKDSVSQLSFSGSPFKSVRINELTEQIHSRNRIVKKLPTWFQTKNIIYPPILNLEQTSSEHTAAYKASLISGNTLADITGGFGVDSFYFAERFENVTYFETNVELFQIARHNFKVLKRNNIKCFNKNGLDVIKDKHFDVIYADPSRRNKEKEKVFFLKDCEPDIPENLEFILNHCDKILLKTSPMLDITVGIEELKNLVSQIHIVAVNNEVKELLFLIGKEKENSPEICTVNIRGNEKQFFSFKMNFTEKATYDNPKNFLYEPNAALMKSGGFEVLSSRLGIEKIHPNSHLFTSENLIPFPGRSFKIEHIVPYKKQALKQFPLPKQANISTRNFPESVATIRKKWKIKDGGDSYLFFTTLQDNRKVVLFCRKV